MAWLYLAVAILFEVAGTTAMKMSEGFTRLTPSILLFVLYGLAFTALTLALRTINLGVAYAIWAGVGTALIAVIAVLVFSESLSIVQIVSLGLIVAGVIGLHLGGTETAAPAN